MAIQTAPETSKKQPKISANLLILHERVTVQLFFQKAHVLAYLKALYHATRHNEFLMSYLLQIYNQLGYILNCSAARVAGREYTKVQVSSG